MNYNYIRLTKPLTKDELLKLLEKPTALIEITEFFGENYKTYNVYHIIEDSLGKIALFYESQKTTLRRQTDDIDEILELLNTMIEHSKTYKTIDVVYYPPKLSGHRTRAPSKKPVVKVNVRKMF